MLQPRLLLFRDLVLLLAITPEAFISAFNQVMAAHPNCPQKVGQLAVLCVKLRSDLSSAEKKELPKRITAITASKRLTARRSSVVRRSVRVVFSVSAEPPPPLYQGR